MCGSKYLWFLNVNSFSKNYNRIGGNQTVPRRLRRYTDTSNENVKTLQTTIVWWKWMNRLQYQNHKMFHINGLPSGQFSSSSPSKQSRYLSQTWSLLIHDWSRHVYWLSWQAVYIITLKEWLSFSSDSNIYFKNYI